MYKLAKIGKYNYIKRLRGQEMTFIGIISEYKNFENIKESLKESLKNEISLIFINKKNISNMKNMYPFHFDRLPRDIDVEDERIKFMEFIVNSQIKAILHG